MKNILLFTITTLILSCRAVSLVPQQTYKDTNIKFEATKLTDQEKEALAKSLMGTHPNYDPVEKMVLTTLNGYNYHTDATSGRFHQVRASFSYALDLLDLGDKQYEQRAFDILEKCISLQDTISGSKTKGIWGYYLEEPLATKKSPPDFNWADFNGATLLEVWMGHQAKIPERLKPIIQRSLILAAQSIQKRNITMSYTNIAIMGTYVTYMVAHLFNEVDMKAYSTERLKRFYDYTLEKGGFTEYNSPAYTIIAIDELSRMKEHIIEPSAKQMIDKLYYTGWEIIAKHYHSLTGQWVGPHSRAYHSTLQNSFYDLINRASKGAIELKPNLTFTYSRLKHSIPTDLYAYFQSGTYPKTQKEVFELVAPKIEGTSYMTSQYALATATRSSMWNQRRPFLAYWGTVQQPKYLQVRFLHDNYDFSSASFYSQQKDNKVLAAINLNLGGGDKHISIDPIKTGKFTAKDLRIRFEFGKQTTEVLPVKNGQGIDATVDGLKVSVHLYKAVFEKYEGRWEKGFDKNGAWWDYVIYNGSEKEFDLNTIKEAAWGFTFSMGNSSETLPSGIPSVSETTGKLKATWQGLELEIPTNILPLPKNL
ncbi:hypothetical protein [Flectobacillus roseus]|uniref:Uncharacterized protein n=1 Tax=Flectobacillus roseus TaxID=502259 RepID=A0ABT6Y764_9BACT|nr:hypothetical protein [Flectobacillus roseus]MDI9859366.1 hypothetical protein [Flectobacillus roseus]